MRHNGVYKPLEMAYVGNPMITVQWPIWWFVGNIWRKLCKVRKAMLFTHINWWLGLIPPRKNCKIWDGGLYCFTNIVAIDGIQVYIAKIQLYAHLLYFHPWRMNNMIQHVVLWMCIPYNPIEKSGWSSDVFGRIKVLTMLIAKALEIG